MSDDFNIPPEAVEALRNRIGHGTGVWVPPSEVRAAIRAALAAWPGMEHDPGAIVTDWHRDPAKIILPLNTENLDVE